VETFAVVTGSPRYRQLLLGYVGDGDLDPFMEASLAQRLSSRAVMVEDVE
jgi:hypothetical protein